MKMRSLLPLARVAPRGDAAMDEAGAVRRLAVLVRFRIERPQLGAGLGVRARRRGCTACSGRARCRSSAASPGNCRDACRTRRAPSRAASIPTRRASRATVDGVDVGQRRVLRRRPDRRRKTASPVRDARSGAATTVAAATSERGERGFQHASRLEDYNARAAFPEETDASHMPSEPRCLLAVMAPVALLVAGPDRADSRGDSRSTAPARSLRNATIVVQGSKITSIETGQRRRTRRYDLGHADRRCPA